MPNLRNFQTIFKIILVDDHKLLMSGLKSVINEIDHTIVVDIFHDSKKVIPYLNLHSQDVDLIITDLNMPGINGFDLIKRIKDNFPFIKIAVMTMYFNRNLIEELKSLSINAYIHKSVDFSELIDAIDKIKHNEVFYSSYVKKINDDYDFEITEKNKFIDSFIRKFSLSQREMQIFSLIIKNKSSQEIANTLFISKDTVSTHRKNIIRKTGCNTTIEMLRLAIELGIDYEIKLN